MRTKRELGHLGGGSLLFCTLLQVRPVRHVALGPPLGFHEDLHVCGFTVFHLLQNCTDLPVWRILRHCPKSGTTASFTTLGHLQFCWWLLTPGVQSGKIEWVQSLIHVELTEVTLTNWDYFIIEIHQRDTVTPSPSLPWKPNTDNRDFILIIEHYTINTNTLHFQ